MLINGGKLSVISKFSALVSKQLRVNVFSGSRLMQVGVAEDTSVPWTLSNVPSCPGWEHPD